MFGAEIDCETTPKWQNKTDKNPTYSIRALNATSLVENDKRVFFFLHSLELSVFYFYHWYGVLRRHLRKLSSTMGAVSGNKSNGLTASTIDLEKRFSGIVNSLEVTSIEYFGLKIVWNLMETLHWRWSHYWCWRTQKFFYFINEILYSYPCAATDIR